MDTLIVATMLSMSCGLPFGGRSGSGWAPRQLAWEVSAAVVVVEAEHAALAGKRNGAWGPAWRWARARSPLVIAPPLRLG